MLFIILNLVINPVKDLCDFQTKFVFSLFSLLDFLRIFIEIISITNFSTFYHLFAICLEMHKFFDPENKDTIGTLF